MMLETCLKTPAVNPPALCWPNVSVVIWTGGCGELRVGVFNLRDVECDVLAEPGGTHRGARCDAFCAALGLSAASAGLCATEPLALPPETAR